MTTQEIKNYLTKEEANAINRLDGIDNQKKALLIVFGGKDIDSDIERYLSDEEAKSIVKLENIEDQKKALLIRYKK